MEKSEPLIILDNQETPIVVKESQLQLQPTENHTREVHILSLAFLLIFLAFGATQNLESTLNTEHNLGTTSLGILYLSFTLFSLFASLVVRLLGTKNSLMIGTSGYWFYVAANLKPNWYTLVPASLYLEFCASIIWVGQLIGNLIAFALLSNVKEGSTTILFIVFLSFVTFGAILMCFLNKRSSNSTKGNKKLGTDDDEGESSSFKSLSISLMSSLTDTKMLLIIPLIAYSGLQEAFVWAEFTKHVVTPAIGVSGVGIAMASYGAFDGIVTQLVGTDLLMDRGESRHITILNVLLAMLFNHDTEGTFAQLKIWQSTTISMVFFLAPYISFQTFITIMLLFLCLSLCSFLWLTLKVWKTSSSPSTSQ
ncbi:UNC93 protein [Trifolium repens]|nr:UNC93 protein [Trifolium repens]